MPLDHNADFFNFCFIPLARHILKATLPNDLPKTVCHTILQRYFVIKVLQIFISLQIMHHMSMNAFVMVKTP